LVVRVDQGAGAFLIRVSTDQPGRGTDLLGLPPTSELELGRRRFRRKQTTRSIVVSLISTVVFAVVMWMVLVNSPGWEVARQTFFDPDYFVAAVPVVWDGLLLNIRVLMVSVVGVAIFATVLASLRSLRGPVFFPVRFLAAAYTDVFRGTPFLIVILLVGFGVPALGFTDQIIPVEFLGGVALVLTYSSYVSEVLRAGMEAVHPSQRLAARSLGLSHYSSLRLVVLPQAIRKVTPALMNDFVSMQKDVGLISVLGAMDAIRQAQIQVAMSYNYTAYVVAGLMFVAFSWPFIRLTDWLTARQQAREQIGGLV
jgi:polar amino acid transport system permease protein